MQSSNINLNTVSLPKILAEIHTKKISGLLKIKQVEAQQTIEIWCWENKIVAVTGVFRLIDKIEHYNWLTPKLIIALQNDNLYEKSIGEKLLKVYNFKPEQLQQLFQEQIKELYNLFNLNVGIAEFQTIANPGILPRSEMTGYDIKIAQAIFQGVKQYFAVYSDDFPESCLTIKSTGNHLKDIDLDDVNKSIFKFINSNKTIKKIARELNITKLEIQEKVYVLQLLGIVEATLPNNTLLESSTNKKETNFEYRHNWKTPLILASILNILIIILTTRGIFEGVEKSLFDFFLKKRGTVANQEITIITVDDEDIEKLSTYPISDEYLAQTIENIKQHKPIAIGLDIYRNIPQPPGHEKLLEVYRNTNNLIGLEKLVGKKISSAMILAEKNQVGFSDLIIDDDNIIRRSLMAMEDEHGAVHLSLGTSLALFALNQKNLKIEQVDKHKYRIGEVTFKALSSQSGGYWQGNDFSGLQTLLNYNHQASDFNQISFWDAYKNQIPIELVQNKIVIIGVTADSEKDFFYTPLSKNNTGLAEPFSGVIIHANVAAQILNAASGEIPMLRVLNKYQEILLIIGFSIIGIVLSLIGLFLNINITRQNQQIILVIQIAVLYIIILSLSYLCFLNGLWIPTIVPLLSAIISSLSISFQHKQELANLIHGDRVTKTANRKYFDKNFNKIFDEAKQQNRELALVMCRKNSLKEHPNSHQDLKRIAEVAFALKGKNDLVARYDDNSIIIVIQNINYPEAEILVTSLRENIEYQLKNLGREIELYLGFAMSRDFTSPIDFISSVNCNLDNNIDALL